MKKIVRCSSEREAMAGNRFFKKVIVFVLSVTVKHGRRLPHTFGDYPFRQIFELPNFGGFTFRTDTRQTAVGGNDVKIWYQPNPQSGETPYPVLEVHWLNTVDECNLLRFDPNLRWQIEILNVIHCQKRIGNDVSRKRREATKSKLRRLIQKCKEKLALT